MNVASKLLFSVFLMVSFMPCKASLITPFISELHYDNAGADVDEFVAVTAGVGFDLSGWTLALHNGSGGGVYRTVALGGVLSGTQDDPMAEAWWSVGLQNGPDAVALIDAVGNLVDFIAYEAVVTATSGAASGNSARLLPLDESGATPIGTSLQRTGSLDDWQWLTALATPGRVNPGLQLPAAEAVPAPVVLWLIAIGVSTLLGLPRQRRRVPS